MAILDSFIPENFGFCSSHFAGSILCMKRWIRAMTRTNETKEKCKRVIAVGSWTRMGSYIALIVPLEILLEALAGRLTSY